MVKDIFSSLQKSKNSVRFIWCLITFIFSQTVIAADFKLPIKFDHFTVEDGLSQNSTYSITQDQYGFVWIATQDGLNRFDGENFVQYRKNNADPHSIADNFIRKVFIDSSNTLWVGTNNGLSRYNRDYDNFENFYNSTENSNTLIDNVIWDIYEDNKGTILVSTEDGLHKFNTDKGYFVRIHFREISDKITAIKTIYQDERDNYWLGTFDNGIYITDNNFKNASNLKEKNHLKLNVKANSLYDIEFINKQFWLGTEQGLFIINADYTFDNQPIPQQLSSEKIRSIEIYHDKVLLGTMSGLYIYDLNKRNIELAKKEKHPKSLSNNEIMDIFQDVNNNIWLASYDGINFINTNQFLLNHHLFNYQEQNTLIENLTQTNDGNIWFSSDKYSLSFLDEKKNINHIELPLKGTLYDLTANNNILWFIDENDNLYNFNTTTKQLFLEKSWKAESNYNYLAHMQLTNQNIWFIDTLGNLVRFDTVSKNYQRFFPDNNSKLIYFTAKGNLIWAITSNDQLFSFDIKNKQFTKHSFSHNSQFVLSAANQLIVFNKLLWIGSASQGLALIDLNQKSTHVFNEHNGLANNFINSIVLNHQGNAWVSTNKGLSFVDYKNNESPKILNFYQDFSLDDNEFLKRAGLLAENGNYYFGGTNGIHEFSESSLLNQDSSINNPIFTNLFIANKKVTTNTPTSNSNIINNEKFVLPKSLLKSDEITLTYQQSPFSIEFISPNNKFAEQVKYRYRLTGLENNWIDAGENNRKATYTNLGSGLYTFEVQAFDINNPEQKYTSSLAINVLPPWWSSNTALFLYAALVLLIIAYFIQQLRYKHQYNVQIKESEERLKLSLWGSGDEMWDWNITDGKIYRSNIWGLLEFPQDGKRNISSQETNIHPADLERVKQALSDHFEEKTKHFEVTYRVKDNTNNWIWVLDRGKIVERTTDNKASRMTGTLKDISGIKKAEEKLKLFAKCIESISDAIVIYDRQFIVVDVNQAYLDLVNKEKSDIIGSSMYFEQYSRDYNQTIKKQIIMNNNWNGEVEYVNMLGEKSITDLNIDIIRDEHGKVSHFVGVFSDITERKKNEAELRKLANTDTLTELPNRASFQAKQNTLVKNNTPHALLVFDLDNFKKINDSMGHEVGDILLCKVAKRLLTLGREQDSVYRLGGDEFSMVIEDTNDIHTITSIAKDVLRTIAIPLKVRSQELVLYSSIGIVLYPEDGKTPEELLKNADTAMYHAKDLGGNKYQFFNESMNKQAVKRLQVENLIRYGLKEDYFSVYYQPKIEIATGKISGMEALVRFETPNKGIISPAVFIPVSEETGQIVDIGEVVLRKACYATKQWLDAGLFDGRVAVNLSAVQFTQPNLVSLIAQVLLQSGLPAKHLELEITEGTVMDSPQRAIETMLQIRNMGIHLSIDDFGTGYSSLAYLKKFPINTLKIDKAFVDDIEESDQGRNMVATIVTIAHNLGLDVVAEGVETENQLSFLSGLRCEQMQGFLYSKPLSEKHFYNYLMSHQITDKSTSFNL